MAEKRPEKFFYNYLNEKPYNIFNFLDFMNFLLLYMVSEKVILHGICEVAEFFKIFRLLWPERFKTVWQQ
jgi:hypothetical protein